MIDSESVTLTVDEIASAKSAIRFIRLMSAIGTAVAIPIVLIFALPVVAYALLGAIFLAPVVIGFVLLAHAGRDDAPSRLSA
jgi:tetrahydromethanopterin S-methyltransferase subunit E